jgi:enterochelin esterase family protein
MAPAYLRRRITRVGSPYRSGDTTTFVFIGDAESVRIEHFMARFPRLPPMERIKGTEVWCATVQLPRGSRVEYRYEVVGKDRTDVVGDPLNWKTASDPFGVNSVALGPGYAAPAWASPKLDVAEGTIETFEIASTAFGGRRAYSAYLPAGYSDESAYPLVVFHDGSDLLEYAALATILDNLIDDGAIRPIVGLLLDPVERNLEYMAAADHSRFVVEDVLAHAEGELAVSTDPAERIIAGASLGAVASLATVWQFPGTFESLILLSGSFVTATGGPWNRSAEMQPVIDLMAEFAATPGTLAFRAWMACGAYEALSGDNREFVPSLAAAGMEVRYAEPLDGHHWTSWRDGIGEALQDLAAPFEGDGTGSVAR